MARIIRTIWRRLRASVVYPRSVFDLSPMDPNRFASVSADEALRSDWNNVQRSLFSAAQQVYCHE